MILWETYFESAQQAIKDADFAKAAELFASAYDEVESETVRDERWLRTVLGWAHSYAQMGDYERSLQLLQVPPEELANCPTELQILHLERLALLQQAKSDEPSELASWALWFALVKDLPASPERLGLLQRAHALAEQHQSAWALSALALDRTWSLELLGPEHEDSVAITARLVQAYRKQEAWDLAEPLIRWQMEQSAGDRRRYLMASTLMAQLLRSRGKAEEAWPLYLEAMQSQAISPEDELDILLWAFEQGLAAQAQACAVDYLLRQKLPAPTHIDLFDRILESADPAERVRLMHTRQDWAESLGISLAQQMVWVHAMAVELESQDQAEQAVAYWDRILREGIPEEAVPEAQLRAARRARAAGQPATESYRAAFASRLVLSDWEDDWLDDALFWARQELVGGNLVTAQASALPLREQLERKSLQGEPLYANTLFLLAEIQAQQQQFEATRLTLRDAFDRWKAIADPPELGVQIAQMAVQMAVDQRDLAYYEEWAPRLVEFGDEPQPFQRGFEPAAAQALMQAGEWSQLEAELREALPKLGPESPDEHFVALLWLADCLEQQGSWNEALEQRQGSLDRLSERLGPGHELTLRAQMQLGQCFNALSRFSEGEKILTQSVRQHEKALGKDSLQVGRVLLALSESFRLQGKDTLMEAVAGRAVGLLEKHLPVGHPERLQAKRDLVQWLMDQGRFKDARQQLEYMEQEEVQTYGVDHPELAVTLSQWASLETAEGNYPAAEAHYRRSLELFERGLGDSHPNVAATLNNLGQNLYRQAKYGEAADKLERALKIFDPNDAGRISSMVNLGLVWQALQENTKAKIWLEEALALSRAWLGEEDLEVAFCCYTLAEVLQELGQQAEAKAMASRALDIREKRLGGLHPETATSQAQLGRLLISAGQSQEAIPVVEGSLHIQVQALGEDHPELIPTYSTLGRLYVSVGQWDKAETVLLRAIHMLDRATAAVSVELAHLVAELGQLWSAQGDLDQAVGFTARAVEIAAEALGAHHEALDPMMLRLAQLYLQKGSFKEAEACFKRVLDQRTKRFGADHPHVALVWLELAGLQQAQGRQILADTLAKKALDLLQRSCGQDDARLKPVLQFLGQLAMASGQTDEARQYEERIAGLNETVPPMATETFAPVAVPLPRTEPEPQRQSESEQPSRRPLERGPAPEPQEQPPEVLEESAPEVAEQPAEPSPEVMEESAPEVAEQLAELSPEVMEESAPEVAEQPAEPSPEVRTQETEEQSPLHATSDSADPAWPEGSLPLELEPGSELEVPVGEGEPVPAWLSEEAEPDPIQEVVEAEPAPPEPELPPEPPKTPEEEAAAAVVAKNWVYAKEILTPLLKERTGVDLAEILRRLAQVERHLGQRPQAEKLLLQAITLWSHEYGENHPELAWAMGDLAEISFEMGKPEQAEGLLRRSTEIQVRLHGTDHVSMVPWLLRLGVVYLPHKPAQALAPLVRAASLAQTRLSPHDPTLADVLWYLALAQEQADELDEAISNLRKRLQFPDGEEATEASLKLAELLLRGQQTEAATQILQKLEVRLPVPAPEVEEQVKALMGHIMVASLRLEEAEPRLLEALQLRTQRLSTQHSALRPILTDLATLYSVRQADQQVAIFAQQALELTPPEELDSRLQLYSQLAPALFRLDRVAEAEAMYRAWLEQTESQNGPNSAAMLPPLQALSSLLQQNGEGMAAQSLREQAWQILSQSPQVSEAEFLLPLEELARGAMEQASWDKAEAWLRRAYAIAEKQDGPSAARLAYALGEVFRATGRLTEAENAIRRSLEFRQNSLGADHVETLRSLQALAEVYSAQSRFEAAQSMLSRCLEAGKNTLGDQHPDLAGFHRALGALWAQTQRLDDAEKSLREALQLVESVSPPHPELVPTLEALGQFYQQLDKLAEAAPLYSRALDSMEQSLGPSHLAVADSLLQLGELQQRQGNNEEAERLFRRCLEIRSQKLSSQHPKLAQVRQVLAQLLQKLGQPEPARALFEQALAALWSDQGAETPQVAECLEGLGLLELQGGLYGEAESRLNKALAIRESEPETQQGPTMHTHQLLARVFLESRRPEMAERALKRALEIAQRVFGGDRPEVASCLEQLGNLYLNQGRYVAAEALFDRALEIRERSEPKQPFESGFALLGLAQIYLAQNQLTQAWQAAESAKQVYEATGQQPNLETAQAFYLMAETLRLQGRYKESEGYYQRCLEIRNKLLGNDHPDVQRGLHGLGVSLMDQGKTPQAERIFTHALRLLESKLGNEHPDLANSLHSLGLLHRSQGRGATAELHLRRALELRTKGLGSEHPELAASLQAMAQLYLDQRNDEAAEGLLKQALSIREKVLRADHPALSSLLLLLAALYKSQERFSEAEPRLKRVLDQREKLLGTHHPDTAAILQELGELYLLNGQEQQAELFLKRALDIYEKRLGQEHPTVLPCLHLLWKVYDSQKRSQDAAGVRSRIQLLEVSRPSS